MAVEDCRDGGGEGGRNGSQKKGVAMAAERAATAAESAATAAWQRWIGAGGIK
jgi:hypothetical protein